MFRCFRTCISSHGDRVEVTEGPLAGLEGLFVQDKPAKGRLVLNVDLLGRSVAVEVDCTAVKACKPNINNPCARSESSSFLLLVWPPPLPSRGRRRAWSSCRRLSFSTTYDDNIFTTQEGSGDAMMLVTPAFEAFYESPNTSLRSLFTFDMQRAVGYSTLNSLDAKRHGDAERGLSTEPAVPPSVSYRPLRRVGSPG